MDTTNNDAIKQKRRTLFWLTVTLLVCLWVGWSDFNPFVAQDLVRENIHVGIRGVIQISIQYVLPISILVFIFGKAVAGMRHDTSKS